jgi:transcriptional regulator with XRE-family HTH domain
MLRLRVAEELVTRRLDAGLSVREVGRRAGLSPDTALRIERAESGSMTIDNIGRIAGVLGLELAASLYPNGDPVRDRAHLALLNRFRSRLGPGIPIRAEVPIPIPGDRRSGDCVLSLAAGDVLIEAETRVSDCQAVERRARAKARDLGAIRLVLLLADTRHNRSVISFHPELLGSFPTRTRACLDALGQGIVPGGDAIVFL